MVFGANTYRQFAQMLGQATGESGVGDPWVSRMRSLPTTVVSSTLEGPLDWPDATVVSGDAVDVIGRLKQESEVPMRSHGSLSLNHALMAAGLVDRVQVTLFPVITGHTGEEPIFGGAADFDLELIESRTLDGNIQELIYRPALHVLAVPPERGHAHPTTGRRSRSPSRSTSISRRSALSMSPTRCTTWPSSPHRRPGPDAGRLDAWRGHDGAGGRLALCTRRGEAGLSFPR
jgi:dihydrofolate reductase